MKESLVDSAALSLRQAEGMRGRSDEQDGQVFFISTSYTAPATIYRQVFEHLAVRERLRDNGRLQPRGYFAF